MSFIGPRPLLMEFQVVHAGANAAARRQAGRHRRAQVQGRHDIPFSKRLALDVWYVDNRSMRLDLKIVGLVPKVLSMRGAQPAATDAEVDDVGSTMRFAERGLM